MSIFVLLFDMHAIWITSDWLMLYTPNSKEAKQIENKMDRWIVKNALPTSNGLNNHFIRSFFLFVLFVCSFVRAIQFVVPETHIIHFISFHIHFYIAMTNIVVFHLMPFIVRYRRVFIHSCSWNVFVCICLSIEISKIEKKLYIQLWTSKTK